MKQSTNTWLVVPPHKIQRLDVPGYVIRERLVRAEPSVHWVVSLSPDRTPGIYPLLSEATYMLPEESEKFASQPVPENVKRAVQKAYENFHAIDLEFIEQVAVRRDDEVTQALAGFAGLMVPSVQIQTVVLEGPDLVHAWAVDFDTDPSKMSIRKMEQPRENRASGPQTIRHVQRWAMCRIDQLCQNRIYPPNPLVGPDYAIGE